MKHLICVVHIDPRSSLLVGDNWLVTQISHNSRPSPGERCALSRHQPGEAGTQADSTLLTTLPMCKTSLFANRDSETGQ